MPFTHTPLTQKLSTFVRLTPEEHARLSELQTAPFHVEKGRQLLHQGEQDHAAYILHAGWGCCFKILQDGGRQVITFPVPGDCIGLRSILLRTSDHSFSAITDAIVSRIEVPAMLRVFTDFPRVGSAILWSTSRDEAITVEHLASIGRRTAIERTAHLFLELCERLQIVGLASPTEFECPLNQYELADALGLSAIHINRVLRELREINLMTFQDHNVIFQDREGLKALAGYEEIEGTLPWPSN